MILSPSVLPSISYATVFNNSIIHDYAVSSSCASRRSLWNIIKSCLTTLFACTWTAIHPNMPGPVESAVAVAIRRVCSMILALVAPELVVMWAVRQHFVARSSQKLFEEALRDGSLELRVKPCCEPSLVSRNVPCGADEVKIAIPEETVKTWSEKLAALCSSMCSIFRRTSPLVHKKLGPSSVSVESLKPYYHWTLKHSFYAWMGGFMLFIDKDPALPRELYHPLTPDELLDFLKEDLVQMSMVSEKDLDDRSKGDWLSKTVAVVQLVWFVVQLIARIPGQLPTTQLEIDALAIAVLSCFSYAFWWHKPKDARLPTPVYWKEPGELPDIQYSIIQGIDEYAYRLGFERDNWVVSYFSGIGQPLLNLGGIHCVSEASVNARRVPYFCGYPAPAVIDQEGLRGTLPVLIFGGLAGMVFGGVHCIAWNFKFPTYTEQILWRIASLTMVVTPGIALAIVIYLCLAFDGNKTPHASALASSSLCVGLLYLICRFILVVLMFLSMRSLPTGVYDAVCWTSLIPHF